MTPSIDGFSIKNVKRISFNINCDVYLNNKKIGAYREVSYGNGVFDGTSEKNEKLVRDYVKKLPTFIYQGFELEHTFNEIIHKLDDLNAIKKYYDTINKNKNNNYFIVLCGSVEGGTTHTFIGAIKGDEKSYKYSMDKLKKSIIKEYSNRDWFNPSKIHVDRYEGEKDFVKSMLS